MKTLLQINSGIFSAHSQSTALADNFAQKWLQRNNNSQVVVRDLINNPVEHLDAEIVMAFAADAKERTDEQANIVAKSDALIAEIEAADAIVVGVPMYNFSIPSQLKAYFDQLARAGVTFHYTETGPQGLLKDKPVYVLAARGGIHKDQPSDSQTNLVKTFFGFIGLHNVQFIYAEGLNMGDEAKENALLAAQDQFESALA